MSGARRYRALLVGNWHFPEDPANLPDLNGPLNDVAGMARVLADPAVSLFRPGDVTTLTERTSYQICAALEHFFDEATRNEVLLLYYSGHGITDDEGALRLTGRDSRFDAKVSTTVSADAISQMIRRCAAAAVVIVLDCCHAGAFKGGDLTAELAGRGRFVLAASRSRQRAPDAEHATGLSRFTGHVLRGMRGAAALPGAEYLTVTDLYKYVRRSMAADGPVVPQWRFDGEGDPPLLRAVAPQPRGGPTEEPVPGLAPVPSGRPVTADRAGPPAAMSGQDRVRPSQPGTPPPPESRIGEAVAEALQDHRASLPGMQFEPPPRSRPARTVRRLGGVAERERTLALVELAGGIVVLFTDAAMYWLDKDRGLTVPLAYRAFAGRGFRAVASVAGMPPTHVDLGDGVPRFAGSAAQALTELLARVRSVASAGGR